MPKRRQWRDLSPRSQKILLVGAVAEGFLKIVALVDLARRPAEQVHGPKWAWAPAITVVNAFGALPLAYLIFGRVKNPSGT